VVAQLLSVTAGVQIAAMLLLWGIGSVGGLVLVTEALRRRLAPGLPALAGLAPVLAAAPLVFPFSVALMFGNLDAWFPLIYGLLLLAALGAGSRTRVAAGISLGAAIVAKLHPASLLLWLLVRGRHQRAMWVVLAATIATGLGLVLASVVIGGTGPWADYLGVVRAEAGALILTPVNVGPAPQVAMLLGAGETTARVIGVAVALGALALTAWAAARSADVVTSLALAAVASLVTLPITWYHYPLALLPFAIAAYLRAGPAQAPAVRILLAAAVFASLVAIVAPVAVWLAVGLVVVAVIRTAPLAGAAVPRATAVGTA
jgi:Glycosyltransferase family 87